MSLKEIERTAKKLIEQGVWKTPPDLPPSSAGFKFKHVLRSFGGIFLLRRPASFEEAWKNKNKTQIDPSVRRDLDSLIDAMLKLTAPGSSYLKDQADLIDKTLQNKELRAAVRDRIIHRYETEKIEGRRDREKWERIFDSGNFLGQWMATPVTSDFSKFMSPTYTSTSIYKKFQDSGWLGKGLLIVTAPITAPLYLLYLVVQIPYRVLQVAVGVLSRVLKASLSFVASTAFPTSTKQLKDTAKSAGQAFMIRPKAYTRLEAVIKGAPLQDQRDATYANNNLPGLPSKLIGAAEKGAAMLHTDVVNQGVSAAGDWVGGASSEFNSAPSASWSPNLPPWVNELFPHLSSNLSKIGTWWNQMGAGWKQFVAWAQINGNENFFQYVGKHLALMFADVFAGFFNLIVLGVELLKYRKHRKENPVDTDMNPLMRLLTIFAKASLTMVVACGKLAAATVAGAAIGAVAAYLVAAAALVTSVYHLYNFVKHAYNWWKFSSSDPDKAAMHKANCIASGKSAVFTGVVATVLFILAATHISPVVCAAVGSAAGMVGMVFSMVTNYRRNKREEYLKQATASNHDESSLDVSPGLGKKNDLDVGSAQSKKVEHGAERSELLRDGKAPISRIEKDIKQNPVLSRHSEPERQVRPGQPERQVSPAQPERQRQVSPAQLERQRQVSPAQPERQRPVRSHSASEIHCQHLKEELNGMKDGDDVKGVAITHSASIPNNSH